LVIAVDGGAEKGSYGSFISSFGDTVRVDPEAWSLMVVKADEKALAE